uniref:Variant Surface Glycoprotein n=1 Tax=Trypanosoma brucei TaxID=5691 RepID=Q26804_9TRYP|nr:Variant Surface Glycoprotein [Trypanosoma brucei]
MQPNGAQHFTIPLTAAFLLLAHETAATANHGLKRQTWEPVCQLSEELDGVTPGTLETTVNIMQTAINMQKEGLRTQVYLAAKPNDPDTDKLAALGAYQATAAGVIENNLKSTGIEKALAEAQTTSYLKGKIDEWLNIAHETKGASHGCLTVAAGTTPVKKVGNTIDGVKCPLTLTKLARKARTPNKLTAGGFQGLRETTADGRRPPRQQRAMQADALRQCQRIVKTDGNTEDSKVTYVDGYIQVTAAANSKAVLAFGGADAKPQTSNHPAWAAAYEAVKAAPLETEPAYKNKTAELTTDEEATTLFALIGAADKPREGQGIETYKRQLFSTTPGKEIGRLMAKVATFKLPHKFGDTKEGTLLGDITELSVLAALLADLQLKNAQNLKTLNDKVEEASKNNQKASVDTCSKTEDKNNCNSKPFCSYNESAAEGDKKCHFNETKASKSGVPVTQTQTAGADTTAEKCKGKGEKDCKSPDCKWEGGTCKDSSILANKQFALSVASAAFVALLF